MVIFISIVKRGRQVGITCVAHRKLVFFDDSRLSEGN